MRCLVNGQEVPCQNLARRGPMNFGQPFPEPTVGLAYQIEVASEEFISKLQDYYERYARQEASEPVGGEAYEFPVLARWQQLGYPPLPELLAEEPQLLEQLVKEWFNQDVLDRIIPGPKAGLPKFLVNSIDRVTVSNGHIQLEGMAYLHPLVAHSV